MAAAEAFVRDLLEWQGRGDYLEKLVDEILQGKTTPGRAALKVTRCLAAELGAHEDT